MQTQNIKLPSICMTSIFVFAATVGSSIGCGTGDKKSNANQPPPEQQENDPDPEQKQGETENGVLEPTPILAFLGGYTSCPRDEDGNDDPRKMDLIDIFESTKSALTAVTGLAQPAYLLSCYGIDPESISYVLSTESDEVHSRTVTRMEKDFADLLASTNAPKVFIVGHSYGAYTALKMIGRLSEATKISGLVTLDAISKLGCTPENALPAVLGIGPAPKECLEAPADISPSEKEGIIARTQNWLNYFQTDSPILHSGEFERATNFKMSYASTGLTPHMDVLFDDDIEASIVSLVVKESGGN